MHVLRVSEQTNEVVAARSRSFRWSAHSAHPGRHQAGRVDGWQTRGRGVVGRSAGATNTVQPTHSCKYEQVIHTNKRLFVAVHAYVSMYSCMYCSLNQAVSE